MTTAATWTLTRLLGLSAVVIAGAAWWVRRTREGRIAPRQVADLGGGQRLCEVTVEGRRLLLGLAPGAAPRLLVELAPATHALAGRSEQVDARSSHAGHVSGEVRAA